MLDSALAAVHDFVAKHRNAFIAAACCIGSFFVGRFAQPKPVVQTVVAEKSLTTASTLTADDVRSVLSTWTAGELRTAMASWSRDLQKNVSTKTTTTKAPDGTVTKTTTVEDHSTVVSNSAASSSKTAEASGSTKTAETSQVVATAKSAEVEKTVTTTAAPPRWGFGLAAKLAAPAIWRDVPNYVPGLPSFLAVEATAERRLIGPLFVTASVNTRLEGGVGLKLELR